MMTVTVISREEVLKEQTEIENLLTPFLNKKVTLSYIRGDGYSAIQEERRGTIKKSEDRFLFYPGRNRVNYYNLTLGVLYGFRSTLKILEVKP